VEVLIFTMHDSDSLLADILSAGARAYLLKSDANQYLIAAVTSLADHKPFFTAKVSEQLLDSYLSAHQVKTDELSPRERVIVQLIAEGHSNRDMSEALGLSLKTIESHRASLMRKLKLKSTAAIVRYAIRNQFVEP
jgi:DNA-binding NarL/FixJ family response regulator